MKSGIVAVIGRANAGKSTLVNVLVGEKVAIVSPKPQTTRDRILGVLTREDYQVVFVDTPGIYKSKNVLSDRMQRETGKAAKDVDLILFVCDAHKGVTDEELALARSYAKGGVSVVAVLTKTDIMEQERLPLELEKMAQVETLKEIIPVSARKGRNIKELLSVVLSHLEEGEPLFPEDVVSNKSEKFMVSEIMREKLLLLYDKEIPHGIAVVVNEYQTREDGVQIVNLDVVCERPNHKAILIGRQGQALKTANTYARKDMEKFLGRKVFLTTYVKVKEDWRNNPMRLKEYGYENSED